MFGCLVPTVADTVLGNVNLVRRTGSLVMGLQGRSAHDFGSSSMLSNLLLAQGSCCSKMDRNDEAKLNFSLLSYFCEVFCSRL